MEDPYMDCICAHFEHFQDGLDKLWRREMRDSGERDCGPKGHKKDTARTEMMPMVE